MKTPQKIIWGHKLKQRYSMWLIASMLTGYSLSGQCASGIEHKDNVPPEVHIVQKGDTLYSIASKYGFNYHELARSNDIQNPGSISIGQEIRLLHDNASLVARPVRSKSAKIHSMEERWSAILKTIPPKLLVRLCREFKRDYPGAKYTPEVEKILRGAQRALRSQLAAELADDTLEILAEETHVRDDLIKALRGDKDSAYRVATMYREGSNGLLKNERRAEQWLKFSAELGSAIASWQLAEIYLATGQQADAAKYEHRAIELGYVPPPRLSNRGY